MKPKYEDWFECLLLVKPRLDIVKDAQDPGFDLRNIDEYDVYLKEMLNDTSFEKYGTDFLEQALEYWLEERDKLIIEFIDGKMDCLDNLKSINFAKEILYYDRAIKITIDKFLESPNKNRGIGKKIRKPHRLLLKDLPKPAIEWAPHFGMKVLSKFCEDLTPAVSDNYVRECFLKEKDDETAPAIKIKDTNNALWAIADDMRPRKKNGEFPTYRAAYRWAAKHMTQNGKKFEADSLENEWHKAKAKGKVVD